MTYLPGSAAQHLNNLYVHEASDISSDIHLEGSSIELVLAEVTLWDMSLERIFCEIALHSWTTSSYRLDL